MTLLSRVHSYMKTVSTHFDLKTKYITIYERIELKKHKGTYQTKFLAYDIFGDCYIR